MAQTKTTGGRKMGQDRRPKYLGVKIPAGGKAIIGNIIVKQRGTKFTAGTNTRRGNDDCIYAVKDGTVKFRTKNKIAYDGKKKQIKIVTVE
jgi:large subunit ribosomal protein L27